MSDNIDNAKEVASETIKVPPDPGGYVIRFYDHEEKKWDICNGAIPFDAPPEAMPEAKKAIRDAGCIATRIIRIPPQGEQADTVAVPRELMGRVYCELNNPPVSSTRLAELSKEIDAILKGGA